MVHPFLGNTLEAVSAVLFWSWSHPTIAGLSLSGFASIIIVWLHIPWQLEYYWQNGQITVRPFNVRNEIPRHMHGRIHVLRFAREHKINLTLGRRIGRTLLEFLLKVLGIPNPCSFRWKTCMFAMWVYPLGYSRREYVSLCIKRRMWPWKRAATLQGILDANDGCLPDLQSETALTSLINRMYS